MTLRDELFQRCANQLSLDIAVEMREGAMSVESVVDALLPKGSPGAQFHRPVLNEQLLNLLLHGHPLDLVTCLQLCEVYDWPIGLIEDDLED